MTFQLVDNSEFDEPVTLDEVKAYSRIDLDYSADDNDLSMFISAARVRIEAQINVGLANRDVILQWDGSWTELPLSPTGDIISVTGKDGDIDPEDYTVSDYQAKSIGINGICGTSGLNFFYHTSGVVEISGNRNYNNDVMYSVAYNTGYVELPKALKMAMLAEVDYLFKQKGQPDENLISSAALLLCASYSRNPIL